MPHMMPMMWILLYFFTIIFLMVTISLLYFFFIPNMTSLKFKKSKTPHYKWTWLW